MNTNNKWVSIKERFPTSEGEYLVRSTGIVGGCTGIGQGEYNATFSLDLRDDEKMCRYYNKDDLTNAFYIYGGAGGRHILKVTHWVES